MRQPTGGADYTCKQDLSRKEGLQWGRKKKKRHKRERKTNTDSQKQKRRKFSSLQSTFLSPPRRRLSEWASKRGSYTRIDALGVRCSWRQMAFRAEQILWVTPRSQRRTGSPFSRRREAGEKSRHLRGHPGKWAGGGGWWGGTVSQKNLYTRSGVMMPRFVSPESGRQMRPFGLASLSAAALLLHQTPQDALTGKGGGGVNYEPQQKQTELPGVY